jgi:carbonic anhydrase
MRLFDAIIDANHRALRGDTNAGLHLPDYASELPIVALTCVDPRLNPIFPGAMALPPESFIWLRNAGNIITGTMSSTMRSLALACAVKGGREIAIIGHTDCQVRRTTINELTERFKALGVPRNQLPENLAEFFGTFASEQQNVIRAVDIVRQSPLIGPKIPVQGLMVDVATGKLEWVVNGYDALERKIALPSMMTKGMEEIGHVEDKIGTTIGEIKFPDIQIGEIVTEVKKLMPDSKPSPAPVTPAIAAPPPVPAPPAGNRSIPVPPPIRMSPHQGRR